MCVDQSFVIGRNSLNLTKTKGYSLAIFSQNEPFWQFSLKAYNICLDCPISKLKYAFSSSWEGLSNDVCRSEFCDRSGLAVFCQKWCIKIGLFKVKMNGQAMISTWSMWTVSVCVRGRMTSHTIIMIELRRPSLGSCLVNLARSISIGPHNLCITMVTESWSITDRSSSMVVGGASSVGVVSSSASNEVAELDCKMCSGHNCMTCRGGRKERKDKV